MTIVVGGVGQLYQGDLDVGRHVAERLAHLGADVEVEDFYYGAVAAMQRLRDLNPSGLVLVGAEAVGADPGAVRRERVRTRPVATWEVQDAVGAASTDQVAVQLIVDVAAAFGALPRRSATIEIEPEAVAPSERLTQAAADAVDKACTLSCREVQRMRVLEQADELSWKMGSLRCVDAAPLRRLDELLRELAQLDCEEDWSDAQLLGAGVRDALGGQEPSGSLHRGLDEVAAIRPAALALIDGIDDVVRADSASG